LGEDVTEELEDFPGRFVAPRIVRPRFTCSGCESFTQAPLPSRPIERGRPGPRLLAHVLVNKYADHLPLYRRSQIFERDGLHLDRSTLADWGEARSRSDRALRRTDRRVERVKRRTANPRLCWSRWPTPSGGTWRPDRRSSPTTLPCKC
jgi:transposase